MTEVPDVAPFNALTFAVPAVAGDGPDSDDDTTTTKKAATNEDTLITGWLYQRTGECHPTMGRQLHKELFFPACPEDGRPFSLVIRAVDGHYEPTEFRKCTEPAIYFSLERSNEPTHRSEVVDVEVPRSRVMAAYKAYEAVLEWREASRVFREKIIATQQLFRPLMERTAAGAVHTLTETEKAACGEREDARLERLFERFMRVKHISVENATEQQRRDFDWEDDDISTMMTGDK